LPANRLAVPAEQATGASPCEWLRRKANARGATPAQAVSHLAEVTDRVHGLLVERADVRRLL
jgi:hypothetical protein